MTANPALVRTFANELCPAPFPEEVFVLRRAGVQIELQGVQTRVKGWQARGALYLSNVRLVFVADKPDELGAAAWHRPYRAVAERGRGPAQREHPAAGPAGKRCIRGQMVRRVRG